MSTALTHGALCNGIGGFSLAARQAGISTIWTCDTDPFCNTVSRRHFPDAHQYLDIYDVSHPQRPDIISAGYPCQPLSYAGQRRGAEDYRWLWPQVRRLLVECRPGWFLGENVAGHLSLGLDGVLADLEAEDYEAWPLVLPACALGAPHRRDRVWIIAHTHDRQPLRTLQALPLTLAVRLLPTPLANDAANQTLSPSRLHKAKAPGLTAALHQQLHPITQSQSTTAPHSGDLLNPRFVLEMMGFPPDWCDLTEAEMQQVRKQLRTTRPPTRSTGPATP